MAFYIYYLLSDEPLNSPFRELGLEGMRPGALKTVPDSVQPQRPELCGVPVTRARTSARRQQSDQERERPACDTDTGGPLTLAGRC